jgi:mannose-1-phosphate guanylyltransferase
MLQTISRIRPLFPWDRIWIVTKPQHEGEVLSQLPELNRKNLLLEPRPKGTAAAISWSVARIEASNPGSVVGVFPTDHLIEHGDRFRALVESGLAWAGSHPQLVTFGIKPERPETAYGYIEIGTLEGEILGNRCYEVSCFHEKPAIGLAVDYLTSDRVFWNSGIFVFAAKSLLTSLERWTPEVWGPLTRIISNLETMRDQALTDEAYGTMPEYSLDKAILETASNIVVFPGSFGWHDLGVWETCYTLAEKDTEGNAIQGLVVPIACKDCLIASDDKILVAAVGIEDMVVVAEGGAVLICPRSRLEKVREIVEKIKDLGLKEYL